MDSSLHRGMHHAGKLKSKAGAALLLLALTAFHSVKTIHLFTVDNLQPVIIPWTVVGVCGALSGPAVTTNSSPDLWLIAARAPQALLWMWLNILTFAIANQRLPDAAKEDKINKSWRALPSGRLTMEQAKVLLLFVVPFDLAVGTWLGVSYITCLAIILSYLYNDLGGADFHWVIRNLLNALAMAVASTGTTAISATASQSAAGSAPFCTTGYKWMILQACLVMTTLQVQDLRDQAGDRARLRSTMPVDLGETFTRWSIAITVMFWSFYCPIFWSVDVAGSAFVALLGAYLSLKVLLNKDVESDKKSWKVWGLWTLVIFVLPLYAHPDVLRQLVQ